MGLTGSNRLQCRSACVSVWSVKGKAKKPEEPHSRYPSGQARCKRRIGDQSRERPRNLPTFRDRRGLGRVATRCKRGKASKKLTETTCVAIPGIHVLMGGLL